MSSSIFKAANTAVITGGASGIGLALAKKCAGYGMRVVVADRDAACLAATQSQLPEKSVVTVNMDVSKPEDWAELKKKIEDEFEG
jgi:NADP-dependent 3-hydroxy acid dehydrogenase YdfG